MKITKNQLKQIVQEEMAAVIREGYVEDFGKGVGYVTDKVVNAPAKIGRAVKKVGSDFLSGFDSQTDVRVPASDRKKPITPEEWAKTANPNDGSPRWADSDYTDAYDAKLASRTGELTPEFERPAVDDYLNNTVMTPAEAAFPDLWASDRQYYTDADQRGPDEFGQDPVSYPKVPGYRPRTKPQEAKK